VTAQEPSASQGGHLGAVSTERRKPRLFAFDLPLPTIQPETLGDGDLTAKIAGVSVSEARKLGIPKTTLWYQLRRLRASAPLKVYRKVARRLEQPFGDAPRHLPTGRGASRRQYPSVSNGWKLDTK
jgi:hypothetical protein